MRGGEAWGVSIQNTLCQSERIERNPMSIHNALCGGLSLVLEAGANPSGCRVC